MKVIRFPFNQVRRNTARRVCAFTLTVFALTFCISVSAQGLGQQPTAQHVPDKPEVTFTSRSELVLVPVVASDHGKHVMGLKKEDFSLSEDGAEHKIAVFEEIIADAKKVAKPNSGKKAIASNSIYTNDPGANTAKRVVILALDTINTQLMDQAYARKQMLKYLAQSVDPDALVSLVMFTPSGVKVIHDFTTDTSVLILALEKLTGKADYASQIPQSQSIDPMAVQTELDELASFANSADQIATAGQRQMAIQWTWDNLNQLAQAFAGVPGRKSLIWVSAGFPFSLSGNNTQLDAIGGNGDVTDNLYAYEHAWQTLNDANFAVYPVDARGLVNPSSMSASISSSTVVYGRVVENPRLTPSGVMANTRAHTASLDTFKDLAANTGGEAYYNTNDLVRSFRQALDDSASYYLLGFYLNRDAKPGWHKLKVEVHHQGTQVRARSGFLVAKEDAQRDRNTDVDNALVSPFDFTGLPISMRWTVQSHAPKNLTTTSWFDVGLAPTSLTLDESDNNHMKVEVIAVAKRPDGSVAGQVGQVIESHASADKAAKLKKAGLIYSNNLNLPPGKYFVRFVVRDWLSGRVGSLSAPLTVE